MENILNITNKIKLSLEEINSKIDKAMDDYSALQNKNEELKKECEIALKNIDQCLNKIEEIDNNGKHTDTTK